MTNVPGDLKYIKEHQWARLENDAATVGITDYAQEQLGEIIYLDLPQVGASVQQFGKFGEIESAKTVSELYSPLTGEVIATNEAALDDPETVNRDPYGEGWLLRVRISNPEEIEALLDSDGYLQVLAEVN